jgi:hypothetical protein
MYVVPDTNAFYGDPFMQRRNFRIVLSEHEHGRIVLAVPEVVLGELPKRFREQFESGRQKAESGLEVLRTLGVDPGEISVPNLAEAEATYLASLRARLDELNVLVPPLPSIGVPKLFDDAVAERRPFQERGRGFKDALIWATVRELAKGDEVVLLTKNHKDFAESDEHPEILHPHLREDLEADAQPPDRVKLVNDLDTFIQRYVPSSAVHLQAARDLLETNASWAADLRIAIKQALMTLPLEASDRVTLVDSDNASVSFNYVEEAEIDAITIVEAYDIGEDEVVSLEVLAHARMQFNFTATSIDAEWLIAERADVDIDIVEETFAQGSTHNRPIRATFAIDFDATTSLLGEPEKVWAEDDA